MNAPTNFSPNSNSSISAKDYEAMVVRGRKRRAAIKGFFRSLLGLGGGENGASQGDAADHTAGQDVFAPDRGGQGKTDQTGPENPAGQAGRVGQSGQSGQSGQAGQPPQSGGASGENSNHSQTETQTPAKQSPKSSSSAAPTPSANPGKLAKQPRRIGEHGIALIKKFEGCARLRTDGLVEAYPDPGTGGSPWTIGWGATGRGIAPGTLWTQEQCDARLTRDLMQYARDVDRALGNARTTQGQFDAMVSFHYNTGAIGRATLTKRHKAGDYEGAIHQFARWNRAGGRILRGLTRRRREEAALYARS